jgi:hypothetical protein
MGEAFSILEKIHGSANLHLISSAELKKLCDELRKHQSIQILAGYRDGDKIDQIEIFVTYPREQKERKV